MSIIPIYNKLSSNGVARFGSEGYDGFTCKMDPDLPIYRKQWIEHNAKVLVETFELENLLRINGGTLPLAVSEWMDLDLFMKEAIKMASNEVTREIQKEQREAQAKLEQKMESNKEYRSPFEGAPKPSFIP